MNTWYVELIEACIFFVLLTILIVFLVCLMRARKRHEPVRKIGAALLADILLLIGVIFFAVSHSTYYRFNDWFILRSDIRSVYEKYGEYDLGSIEIGKSGKVAYYIYTDDGPIMPDHMDHYYWIYYDENGVVYQVGDHVRPGG